MSRNLYIENRGTAYDQDVHCITLNEQFSATEPDVIFSADKTFNL